MTRLKLVKNRKFQLKKRTKRYMNRYIPEVTVRHQVLCRKRRLAPYLVLTNRDAFYATNLWRNANLSLFSSYATLRLKGVKIWTLDPWCAS